MTFTEYLFIEFFFVLCIILGPVIARKKSRYIPCFDGLLSDVGNT